MITSTPDATRQLLADHAGRLAAEARPRRVAAPSRRSQAPPLRWRTAGRVSAGRTTT